MPRTVVVRQLGRLAYQPVWEAMRDFTLSRRPHTLDEIWLLEHEPVYTLGQAGKREHLLRANGINLVQSDRGGQITYHGPGQLVMYTLLDLRRLGLGIKSYVQLLEQAVVEYLRDHGIDAHGRGDAPGVYVGEEKIAALGLRVKNGCCYHGLSFNIALDLAPFESINPCGYAGLRTTQLSAWMEVPPMQAIGEQLVQYLLQPLQCAAATARKA